MFNQIKLDNLIGLKKTPYGDYFIKIENINNLTLISSMKIMVTSILVFDPIIYDVTQKFDLRAKF